MFDSILKPNATAGERAIEQAIRKVRPDLGPIPRLMDPRTCPEALLPWLAWAFSVDVWEPHWPEAQRRAAVAASIDLHRVKGTPGSVRRALGALGLEIAISEWWEHGGRPYTFRVVARPTVDLIGDGTQPFLSAELRRQIEVVLAATKPLRAHADLTFLLRFTGAAARGAAMAARSRAGRCLTPVTIAQAA
ncbi:MAG: phage tail protein I, partial [Rhodospirillales bacterium]|nr:phage tail protein I [Rhodospirillales bacterium]